MSQLLATEPAAGRPGIRVGAQYATFFVDGLFFGVDVLEVQEILREQTMTPVPLAPAEVEGLINLRGQIVTALDMRRRLGLAPRAAEAAAMNVVIHTGGGAVSLLVDEIGDVIETGAAALEPPPENLSPQTRDLIAGIFQLEERLLLLLDVDKTVQVTAAPAPGPAGV
jgi:purine-binding chemotaxis protein CheW